VDSEATEDVDKVVVDGSGRDAELVGDFLVKQALADMAEDFFFARGQAAGARAGRGGLEVLCQQVLGVSAKDRMALTGAGESGQEFVTGSVLDQVPCGSGCQAPDNLGRFGFGAENKHGQSGDENPEPVQAIRYGDAGRIGGDERDLRRPGGDFAQGLLGAGVDLEPPIAGSALEDLLDGENAVAVAFDESSSLW
jgi:hypothetical protein